VEHALHALLTARPHILGYAFQLVSDTERTAPRRFRGWSLARELAERILQEFTTVILSHRDAVAIHLEPGCD
jgi:hypothetical protein